MAETKPEQLRGHAFTGPCDGKEFLHTADMRRVKINDDAKKPHVYVYHEELSKEQSRRGYLWQHTQAWKYGKA